jgi:hypothetical protein
MATSHLSGPLATVNAPSFSIALAGIGAPSVALSVGSGTIQTNWRVALPSYPTKLFEIGMTFPRGGTSAPQGGTFAVKVWSGASAKGVFVGSVAGATVENLKLTLAAGATFAANAELGLALHTVGATSPGRQSARPTLYMGYR